MFRNEICWQVITNDSGFVGYVYSSRFVVWLTVKLHSACTHFVLNE